MNAREHKRLTDAVETYLPLEYRGRILSALALQAAAEANDGSTALTDALVLSCGKQESTRQFLDRVLTHARTLERERQGLAAEVGRLTEDATKWRAFIGCKRIRVIGWAELNTPTPYAHIGLELWTMHEADSEPNAVHRVEQFVAKCVAIDAERAGK